MPGISRKKPQSRLIPIVRSVTHRLHAGTKPPQERDIPGSVSSLESPRFHRNGSKGNYMLSTLFNVATVAMLVILVLAPQIADRYLNTKDLKA